MTYPPISREKVNRFLEATKKLIEKMVSQLTLYLWVDPQICGKLKGFPIGTEYRIGTYIYNDRSLMERKVCREEDCALTVLATVVSTPTPKGL